MARAILATNPKVVAELKEGNLKGAGWLIGQAKRKDPNVNPNRFREICLQMVRQM
jgi:aspartyl-tRNA(Asn)/glutamyl-tRNA(Gln) amidotransferase subunit B